MGVCDGGCAGAAAREGLLAPAVDVMAKIAAFHEAVDHEVHCVPGAERPRQALLR